MQSSPSISGLFNSSETSVYAWYANFFGGVNRGDFYCRGKNGVRAEINRQIPNISAPTQFLCFLKVDAVKASPLK